MALLIAKSVKPNSQSVIVPATTFQAISLLILLDFLAIVVPNTINEGSKKIPSIEHNMNAQVRHMA